MGLISWILFGALAGWIASLIAGTNERQGCLMNVVVGVVGAFIGGFVLNLLTGRGMNLGFNIASLAVAIVGALILLALASAVRR